MNTPQPQIIKWKIFYFYFPCHDSIFGYLLDRLEMSNRINFFLEFNQNKENKYHQKDFKKGSGFVKVWYPKSDFGLCDYHPESWMTVYDSLLFNPFCA